MFLPGLPNATIALRDLETLASLAVIRLPLRAPECRRLRRLTEFHEASTALHRRLDDHSRCALLHSRSVYGTENLAAETAALFSALSAYAGLLRDIAAEYERFADKPVAPIELLLASGSDRRAGERSHLSVG